MISNLPQVYMGAVVMGGVFRFLVWGMRAMMRKL